jgi:DNA-binding CsgD family transcriptional regulator
LIPNESDLIGLIGLVYDATENQVLWSEFLQRYAGAFGADLAFYQLHRLGSRAFEMISGLEFSLTLQERDSARVARLNGGSEYGGHHFLCGSVALDEQMFPRTDRVKSEFYNDCRAPMGNAHDAAEIIDGDGSDALTLAAMRGRQRPPFGETERQGLRLLLPHVTRAKGVAARLQMFDASTSVLDALDIAIAFMTSGAELIHCSEAAEAIISSGDGLTIINGKLRATEPRLDARLREAFRATSCAGRAIDSPATVTIDRQSAKRPYQLLLSPLRHGLASFNGMRQPEVVVLILDPDNVRPAALDVLQRAFGLTRREAALASVLSTGKPIDEAADEIGMAYETARSHLRRIFDKTQTSRQTELITVLARLPKD